eukprot:6176712-Pleurochrysis_carterae.AAC.2
MRLQRVLLNEGEQVTHAPGGQLQHHFKRRLVLRRVARPARRAVDRGGSARGAHGRPRTVRRARSESLGVRVGGMHSGAHDFEDTANAVERRRPATQRAQQRACLPALEQPLDGQLVNFRIERGAARRQPWQQTRERSRSDEGGGPLRPAR